ncbi:MAG: biotin synthase BioB [Clostridiales bacterium]|nr:biotin synthase BioB [Clostridiales bacterium]
MNLSVLADEIIEGRRLTREDDLSGFVDCSLEELRRGADRIRAHFRGDRVDLCTIINGRSGHCSEDCKYCAQSGHNHTGIEEYEFLSTEQIVREALANERGGVDRFSIVTAGRCLSDSDFEKAIDAYRAMSRQCKLELCASHGLLTADQLRRLREAGVTGYHANIETSRRFFPYICTTHTYDDRIDTIRRAQEAGLRVCSGGIIGMGETWEDRLDMAVSLSELHVMSIPINALNPIPGTPLAGRERLEEKDILRTIAFFRYLNPEADIRLAAGRALLTESGKEAFSGGASATITGNMLTTTGSDICSDRRMLTAIGRRIAPGTVPNDSPDDASTAGHSEMIRGK